MLPEFDQHARKYDELLKEALPPGMAEDHYFAEYKVALMAERLARKEPVRLLDFGCGAGRSLVFLEQYFPRSEIWGYDISSESLALAASRTQRSKLVSDWAELGGVRFDAILAANVFHHIPVDQRLAELARCRRQLSAGGEFFLFEHNPFNLLTRWVFERCQFDKDARMLSLRSALDLARHAEFADCRHGYTLFFPRPLARLRGLEPLLRKVPLGAQYYVQMAA